MIEVRALTEQDVLHLERIITGYTTNAHYRVGWSETEEEVSLTLRLTKLERPFPKRYNHLDEETLQRYQQVPQHGYSFGAFDGSKLTGAILAEPHSWNNSLWVWELHVADAYRRQGIGRQLIEALVEKGTTVGFRTVVCETQNTNVPAIRFYRHMGFHMEGVDISYYSNEDLYPRGEIAVFMKRRLDGLA
jgi:ribosomal protein S18 acetylase RimI-like enzyme